VTSRYRFPSESPTIPRSRRFSSVRSSSSFSLASSDDGDGPRIFGRAETADYDRRTRNVRPRESREGSATVTNPAPSLLSVPITLSESTATVSAIIEALYVQDIDAEEVSPDGNKDKDKLEFKQTCLDLVLGQLFDVAGLAGRISAELGNSITWKHGL